MAPRTSSIVDLGLRISDWFLVRRCWTRFRSTGNIEERLFGAGGLDGCDDD